MHHTSPWTLTDGILAINLDSRPERWTQLVEQAAGVGIGGQLTRIPAVAGVALPGYGRRPWFRKGHQNKAWAGRAGCTLSHRRAIEHAKRHGWKRVLIIEDDAKFTAEFNRDLPALTALLAKTELVWDVVYLGYSRHLDPTRDLAALPSGRKLIELFGGITTHAYILKDTTYDWLLAELPDEKIVWSWIARHRAIDRWYCRNLAPRFRVLAVTPSIVVQGSDFSDVGQCDNPENREQEFLESARSTHADEASFRQAVARQARRLASRRRFDYFRGILKRLTGF